MKKPITTIVILGLWIHVLLLITIFDTYFKSPLEHGMIPVQSTKTPTSKRVVLFVADGLRAQAILGENEDRAPFLTSIRKHKSSWGISHTRVPTESRPGHVAMLAGIFEDPSAIFKGWKHNPVDFDSVINQSSNAWCIGSPDIVPIFNKDGRKHIHIHAYDAEMQDFGNKDTTLLDKWVFDTTKWILNENMNNEVLNQSGNVFFLHLLGLDTAGHAFKPHSKEYIDNIKFVDNNMNDMTKLFNKVFPDGLTSFVFTADHGMTNWGSHGSGLDHETFTPIIVWGSGIENSMIRKDMKQIDIAPLISSLIGINYPTNNLGKLPVDYLNVPKSKKLQNFLTNIQQVFKIFIAKQQKIEKSTFFYKPYKYMTVDNFDKNFTELWFSNETYDVVMKKCDILFDEILKAIEYCHNYFMNYILLSVSLGLILWLLYLSSFLFVEENIGFSSSKNELLKIVVITYGIFVFLMCFLQSFSFLYYIYFLFPGFMFYIVSDKFILLYQNFPVNLDRWKCFYLVFYLSSIILFIYGFQYRSCFSFMMVLISVSIFLRKDDEFQIETSLKVSWVVVCLVLAIFPLLPLMFTKFQTVYFVVGYISWLFFSLHITSRNLSDYKLNTSKCKVQKALFCVQNVCFHLSFINSLVISFELLENSTFLKYVSWVLFFIPLVCIPFSVKILELRIFTIFLAFSPFYLMTTMSYELIFLTLYCVLLTLWVKIEKSTRVVCYREFENFRKCLIFVSTILLGFFGTGNIASLNSFDPMWVRCFLTVFSPFTMTTLIMVKLLIPFLFSACVFRDIVLRTRMNLTSSFCVILLISDVMVFYFMYHIKNVGSWLEIGTSLSHFIVVECFTIGILVLYFVAYLFTNMAFNLNMLSVFRSVKNH
ncbi:GPI ethanolamine phosphate transferase 1-like [Coccinella septempunctata]|uniref:GPI ethanolamine phosphate transferase 1-like n=1 Tax=Coccinella septempunctata TaxID=41139 RepID=UPI001D070BF1|nr:GPI ethanolamine phosphate transferase 1-like [Coccinella septempunctata]